MHKIRPEFVVKDRIRRIEVVRTVLSWGRCVAAKKRPHRRFRWARSAEASGALLQLSGQSGQAQGMAEFRGERGRAVGSAELSLEAESRVQFKHACRGNSRFVQPIEADQWSDQDDVVDAVARV